MWLPLLALILGLIVGISAPVSIPPGYASYLAIAILSALDSVVGGLRAAMDGQFDNLVFISGFFINILLATLLTYLGVRLGVDLVLGATVTFSIRIFTNLGIIRTLALGRLRSRHSAS